MTSPHPEEYNLREGETVQEAAARLGIELAPEVEELPKDHPANQAIDEEMAQFHATRAEERQYEIDVHRTFRTMDVAPDSPEWAQWCAEMDEWNAAR